MEFFAASWWFWLTLTLVCFTGIGINWVLVTYGTAIDVGTLAYKATKLKREDLPSTKEEFKDVAVDVAKDQAKSYIVARATSKFRKIFFGFIMMGIGALSAGLFLTALLMKAILWAIS